MRTKFLYGFNVIELSVVTAVVMSLVLALIPVIDYAVIGANGCSISVRGKDIYVCIVAANMEREPLGLPSVWPSENPPVTNASTHAVECFNFTNSTDYFSYLLDGTHLGTDRWKPFVEGCDFSKLAGGGVPVCTEGKLTAANNMWTIAMNVREDLEDVVPVLITRNVDASSLAAKVTDTDWDKSLRFDPEWATPFRDNGFLMIRKGGAISMARAKKMSYGVVYGKQTFDATVDGRGVPVAKPLKYLTPTHMVVPGERAFAEGAARVAQLSGVNWRRMTRDLAAMKRVALPIGGGIGVVYLLVAVAYGVRRFLKRLRPCLAGNDLRFGLLHFAATVL